MDLTRLLSGPLRRVPRRIADPVFRLARRLPPVRRRVEAQYEAMLASVLPGRDDLAGPRIERLPAAGLDRGEALGRLSAMAESEESAWREGFASGSVYHGDPAHIDLVSTAYTLHSQSNPLHSDLWPSTNQLEAEIVAMVAGLLGGDETDDEICGTITSGGTESIFLAMKAYRDRAGIRNPEIVAPATAHVAFDKAAHLLGMKLVSVPVGADFAADVEAMGAAMTRRTVAMVGSAPGFPHGVVDPIAELSELARERGVGFHSDACLGGFILPFVDGPPVGFELPGVTSLSVDTHKYGYAPKGTSVVLYRGRELRRHQYFTLTDWPGGLYYSPTLAGSRPGGLSAAAWVALATIGEQGYRDAALAIVDAGRRVKEGVADIPGLHLVGDADWVIAFGADDVDIYAVLELMAERGWSLVGLQHPPAIHLAVTLRHTVPGVVERFLEDLRAATEEARATEATGERTAPIYGVATSIPARGVVAEMLERYVDRLYEP